MGPANVSRFPQIFLRKKFGEKKKKEKKVDSGERREFIWLCIEHRKCNAWFYSVRVVEIELSKGTKF